MRHDAEGHTTLSQIVAPVPDANLRARKPVGVVANVKTSVAPSTATEAAASVAIAYPASCRHISRPSAPESRDTPKLTVPYWARNTAAIVTLSAASTRIPPPEPIAPSTRP